MIAAGNAKSRTHKCSGSYCWRSCLFVSEGCFEITEKGSMTSERFVMGQFYIAVIGEEIRYLRRSPNDSVIVKLTRKQMR